MLNSPVEPTLVSKPAPYQEVVPTELHELCKPLAPSTLATTPPPLICASAANTLPFPNSETLQTACAANFEVALPVLPLLVIQVTEILCESEVVLKKVTALEVSPEQCSPVDSAYEASWVPVANCEGFDPVKNVLTIAVRTSAAPRTTASGRRRRLFIFHRFINSYNNSTMPSIEQPLNAVNPSKTKPHNGPQPQGEQREKAIERKLVQNYFNFFITLN